MFYGPPVPARHVEIYERIQHARMPLIGHGNYARSLRGHIDNLALGCISHDASGCGWADLLHRRQASLYHPTNRRSDGGGPRRSHTLDAPACGLGPTAYVAIDCCGWWASIGKRCTWWRG